MRESIHVLRWKQEGKDEGRLEGLQQALRKMLEGRFGTASEELLRRINETTDAQRLQDAIVGFWKINSPDELKL